jgi:hypothetical protein
MTQQVPRRSLTIHSGTLSARVQPILGENRRSRGTFDIPTPLARLSDITLTNAPVTIFNEGMTLKARVEATRLDAFNGSYRGERNTIRGHIIIDGQRIDMPPQDLDPEYDQAAFDRRYACTDDLRGTVPPSGP